MIAAAAAVAVAAAVVAFFALAQPARAPRASVAGTSHATGRAVSAARWHTYVDPGGFTISLPPGWKAGSRTADKVQFTGPSGGFALVVAWSTNPQAGALADWQQQSAEMAADDASYHEISIGQVSYGGYNAADWQFTDTDQGVRIRVIDRTFIVRPGQLAYAVELSGPASQWPAVYASIWQPLLASFQPAS